MADETDSKRKLCKIVYFDEGSATDFVQIVHGGGLTTTTELLESGEDRGSAAVGAEAKVGLGALLHGLLALGHRLAWMPLFPRRLIRARWRKVSLRTRC